MSRSQVTITLGRSGQVVKRHALVSDDGHFDYALTSRGKRSMREKAGSFVDHPWLYGSQSKNKRQRRDSNKWSPNNNVMIKDSRVGKEDLRLKLMRKNMSRQTRSNSVKQRNMYLYEKLSRNKHCPMETHTGQHMPEPKASLLRRIPPTRTADDLLHMDSFKNSYSLCTLDRLRCRSPDKKFGTSRGLSPPSNINELQQAPSIRPVDASRPRYMSKDILDTLRVTGHPPFMVKASVPLKTAKPTARLLPPGSIMQKNPYMGVEPHAVARLLYSLGLGKYAILFQAEEVDMTALRQMGDNDLKELGIPMGPRKKILLAVLPHSKR